MTISDVLAKIKAATSLKVEHRTVNCAVCHLRGSEIVAIYAPKGDSIPLCDKHMKEVEQAVQDRTEKEIARPGE